jgi:hypothetical protein
MGRCGSSRRRRGTRGPIWGRKQYSGPPVGDAIDALGARSHLDIEDPLILGGDLAGPLEQDPQLRIGVSRPDMSQDRALTSMFTHYLHCHRTRGRAHLPHVRHRQNLPA